MSLALSVYAPAPAAAPWTLAEALGTSSPVRFFSLGRWALREALRLAGAGPGRPVLFPEFFCREVLASAAVLDAPVAFYPVAQDLSAAFDPASLPPAAAVVAVDFFGFPQDLAPFEAYSRRTGAVLVEDAAHGFLTRDALGRRLGTRAPLGVLSQRKVAPLPDGGALVLNDPALARSAAAQLPHAQEPAEALAFQRRRAFLRSAAPWLGARGTHAALSAGRFVRAALGRTASADPDAERVIPVAPEPSPESAAPVASVDMAAEAERRRGLYALCAEVLRDAGARPVFPALPEGVVPYGYPFRPAPGGEAKADAALAALGLGSLPWPDVPDAVRPRAPRHYLDVRLAHFLW